MKKTRIRKTRRVRRIRGANPATPSPAHPVRVSRYCTQSDYYRGKPRRRGQKRQSSASQSSASTIERLRERYIGKRVAWSDGEGTVTAVREVGGEQVLGVRTGRGISLVSPDEVRLLNPLRCGSSRKTVSANIREMRRAGYSQRQAVAAALETQRRSLEGKCATARRRAASGTRSRLRRRNPAPPAIDTLHRMFQGRPVERVLRTAHASRHVPRHVAQLGELTRIDVNGQPIRFNPRDVRLTADSDGNLHIVGARFAPPRGLARGEVVAIGEIDAVYYITAKDHLYGHTPYEFVHKMGEEGGSKPILAIDRDGYPIILGGDYVIAAEGIIN